MYANTVSTSTPPKKSQLTEEEKHKILIKEYLTLPETQPFKTSSGGVITATADFKYLGSIIHFTMRDRYDINTRIKKAGQIMGALSFFWRCDDVDIQAKKHIYCACVLTILLWGVETWALTDGLVKQLNVFHHCSIRSILRIKME